jgi:hypothetical protein
MQRLAERLARAGMITRGVLYALVGWLAVQVALGDHGERVDQKGAMATLVRQPMGRVLVFALAVGFLAYAVWRIVDAVFDPGDEGPLKRGASAGRAAIYLALAATAVRVAARGAREASGHEQQDATAKVLGWRPLGQWIVVVVGLAVIGVGLWNAWQAASGRFQKQLKSYEMSAGERRVIVGLARVGLVGRAVAWVLSGGFVVRAALRFDPAHAVGLDAALHQLVGEPFGPVLLAAVGVGLVVFGAYQLALARYRRVMGS